MSSMNSQVVMNREIDHDLIQSAWKEIQGYLELKKQQIVEEIIITRHPSLPVMCSSIIYWKNRPEFRKKSAV